MAPFAGFEDILTMLADMGGDAVWQSNEKKVFYDETDVETIALETGGSVVGKRIVLRGRTGDWPTVKIGDVINVKSKGPMWNYTGTPEAAFNVTVKEMRQEEDGAITAYYCTK